MKLVRIASIYITPGLPDRTKTWLLSVNGVEVRTIGAKETTEHTQLVVESQVQLDHMPTVAASGHIEVPTEARTRAERAIETLANVVSIGQRRRRRISSPHPHVAMIPESDDERRWLDGTAGFLLEPWPIPTHIFSIDKGTLMAGLEDRLDGAALLAEALAQEHATGKLHEFLRVFERAFALSSSKLAAPLAKFLAGTPYQFTESEVRHWVVDLRHPATHADLKPEFAQESDVRPFIHRIEDAAYDVLFNKEMWRSNSAARRDALRQTGGSRPSGAWVVAKKYGDALVATFTDPFRAYPLDTAVLNDRAPNWWFKENVTVDAAGNRQINVSPFNVSVIASPWEPDEST